MTDSLAEGTEQDMAAGLLPLQIPPPVPPPAPTYERLRDTIAKRMRRSHG
jgi:hypothetical protein